MPIATTPDQRSAAQSVRSWAERAKVIGTVRAQEHDATAWRRSWPELAELGLFAMALPESHGGLGAAAVDLAVVLEQAADSLVPGPVLGGAITGLMLARVPGAEGLAARVADGAAVGVAVGIVPGEPADGGLLLSGPPVPVVCGEGADLLLVLVEAGGHAVYVLIDAGDAKVTGRTSADLTRPMAEASLDGVLAPADRVLHGLDMAVAGDIAITLAAAEAAGVAGWALRTASAYAKVREQFGKPIGSFQAIKHLCAEMLCRAELAAAVAWDAAGALDDDGQRPIAAAVAGAIALDAAVENAKDCIQVLGGIGFTWEHDAHLYLRRAIAARQLSGGSGHWRRQVADLTTAGARRVLAIDLGEQESRREVVRSTARQIAALPTDARRGALAEAGYLAPHWPAPHGLGAGAAEQLLIAQELERAGVERPDLVIAGWAIPTILQYGDDAQRERFVAPTLRGEIAWCQLFSEPGAGSDLAALRTKAERVQGGWRLTGQKVWTSLAQRAHWGICLARTNPDAPKHKGITYFLVDMKSAGLDIRPLREITGEALFNEVFLDDVFVPDDCVVGEIDNGWTLARATLANERVAMGGKSSIGEDVEQLVALAERNGVSEDAVVRDKLGAIVAQGVAGSLLDVRSTQRQLDGQGPGPESSVRKLVGVRHRQEVAETALDLLGVAGAEQSRELWEFLQTRCLTIAGGTTQVLLTLAGERLLGLPRG
ncbi:acyl-CoA dehydrogenase [Jatrophihabitans sp.]|uniref:acyl-CoA dehydrogenase n=1 Tax=Jatrophihabitans sp. TaxID=1932789 RepID=UPI0030C6C278|nr:acyl-CoA dehydrogenase [Jatrophihabitans sp.]